LLAWWVRSGRADGVGESGGITGSAFVSACCVPCFLAATLFLRTSSCSVNERPTCWGLQGGPGNSDSPSKRPEKNQSGRKKCVASDSQYLRSSWLSRKPTQLTADPDSPFASLAAPSLLSWPVFSIPNNPWPTSHPLETCQFLPLPGVLSEPSKVPICCCHRKY